MNQILVSIQVRGVFREEGGVWVAGFPRLEVYSQGDTPEEAKHNAEEALRLWVDSCLDRGTLGDALRELGWHREQPGEVAGSRLAGERTALLHLEDVLGEPWDGAIEVPAYQAAELMPAGV